MMTSKPRDFISLSLIFANVISDLIIKIEVYMTSFQNFEVLQKCRIEEGICVSCLEMCDELPSY